MTPRLRRTLAALALSLFPSTRALGQAETLGGPTKREVDVQASDGGTYVPVGEDAEAIVPPALAVSSPAAYPEALASSAQPVTGTVTLELLVAEDGSVGEAVVAEGAHPLLDASALDAGRRLKFTPATQGGRPVAVRIRFQYHFVAPEKPAPRAWVKGEVRAKGTRRPLAGATVLEKDQPLGETDAQGRFAIELSPGEHWLRVKAPGHKPAAFPEKLVEGQSLEVVYRVEPLVVDPYETIVRGQSERTEVSRITLTEQELREVPGTQGDPFRVVMLMPGVSSLASGVSYPVVRGSQPAATGYYLDGVRIPALFHLALGPAVVHPDFIDRIDFFPGTPPAQYGRVLGGVVEGTPSRPRDDRLHASAYADLINAGAFAEYAFPETGTHVTLSGRFSYSGWLLAFAGTQLSQPDPDGYRSRAIADFWDYQGRIEQKLGGGSLRLLAFGSSDVVGMESDNPTWGVDTRIHNVFHRVDLRYRKSLDLGDTELGITWGSDSIGGELEYGPKMIGEYVLDSREFSARAGWSKAVSDQLRFAAGVDLDHKRGRTTTNSELLALQAGVEPSTFQLPKALGTFFGGYAEATWAPVEPLSVTAGLRADNFHLTPGIDRFALDPRFAARYRLLENLTLKAGGAIVHQPPTVLLTLPVMDIAGLRYGLQGAATGELGAEWKPLEGLEVSLEGYYTHLFSALEFDLAQVFQEGRRRGVLGQDRASWGRSYGVELLVRHPLGKNWFGWISYALQRSQRYVRYAELDPTLSEVTELRFGELPFAFDQTHVFNLALSYQFPGNVTLGTVVHLNTGRPESGQISSRTSELYTDPDTGEQEWRSVGRAHVGRLPPFVRVDVRAAKKWTFDDHTVELYLDVLNASLQQETLGYDYTFSFNPQTGEPGGPVKNPIALPVIVPMLGIKGTY